MVLSQYAAPGYAARAARARLRGPRLPAQGAGGRRGRAGRAIRAVASGGSVDRPAVVDALVNRAPHPNASSLDTLTPRETQMLAEMAQGKYNAAIAAALVLSERAVEKHTNIFSKLGLTEEKDVNRRVMAVLMWFDGDGATASGPGSRP